MEVELFDTTPEFTEQEKVWVERLQKVLAPINFFFDEETPGLGKANEVAAAILYDKPLRLDFKAHDPARGGCVAFFKGPWVVVTEALFQGDSLAPLFELDLRRAAEEYREYLRNYVVD